MGCLFGSSFKTHNPNAHKGGRMKRKRPIRRIRIERSTHKSVYNDYEWQKKRLSLCPEKYEAEAKQLAEVLGL
jgi:hypothetical protein